MGAGTVVVTSRSFAVADPSPRLELESAGLDVVRADPRHDRSELADLLPTAVAWIAGTSPVTDEMLALGPRLSVLARYGVGYDAVDVDAATRRGVWVTTTPGANTEAVADLTLALLLDLLRSVTAGVAAVARGDWRVIRGRELGASTVGLLGFGRIGQAVARRVQCFGAQALAVDPQLSHSPVPGVDLVDLATVEERCDLVSLHAPGGQLLLDRAQIGRLQPGVTVVNTARADLVDEQAMADALGSGQVRSYAADTVQDEHAAAAASPLLAADLADRVLVTPHLGGQTEQAVRRMGQLAVRNVLAVLRGDVPPHPLNEPGEL